MAIITDNDLKVHLGLTGVQHNTVVSNAVNAANQAVVQFCGRNFDDAGAVSARVYYPENRCLVKVDDFHTQTGLLVKTDEGDDGTYETTWAATDFQVEPLNGRENDIVVPWRQIRAVESREFPTRNKRPSVEVTARWGWASVPPTVFEATLIKGARVFHRKDSPQGVAGFGEFGVVRLSPREDGDVMLMLQPFRRVEQFIQVG